MQKLVGDAGIPASRQMICERVGFTLWNRWCLKPKSASALRKEALKTLNQLQWEQSLMQTCGLYEKATR